MLRINQLNISHILYFLLSIIINLIVFVMRISAHEISTPNVAAVVNARQYDINRTELLLAGTKHQMIAATVFNVTTTSMPWAKLKTMAIPTIRLKGSHSQTLRNHQSSRTVIKLSSSAATNSTVRSNKTDAPMLNYIFDSYLASNKHHHHDRYGPHFDDVEFGDNIMNVSAQAGSTVYLNCRISLLQDKTVSWVKRESNNENLQLLTVGMQTYSGDPRFSVEFQYPNNWRLRIVDTNKTDEGQYECQISTHPVKVIVTYFHVHSPEVIIMDEFGSPLVDKYYQVDSTIQLVCIVRYISMTSSVVYWLHGSRMLNFDMTRGGISVKTDLMEDGANSTLFMAKVRKSDSGNYTCSIGPNDFYTINVHIVNEESLAELYHGLASENSYNLVLYIGMIVTTQLFRKYC